MLHDWLWACLITLVLWLEVAGWARVVARLVLSRGDRRKLPRPYALALGFAFAAQLYFVATLWGVARPAFHVTSAAVGLLACLLPGHRSRRRSKSPPALHLSLARYLSPLSWKRAFPWLSLPLGWALLKFLDALTPSNDAAALAYHLEPAWQWSTTGLERLDPLNPARALASAWEALYAHGMALAQYFAPSPRAALLRGQLISQLLHFSAGQVLTILVLSRFIFPHGSSPRALERRHQFEMPARVTPFSALFFAWLACAQVSPTATLARNEWGSALFSIAALVFVDKQRLGLGLFMAALAGATNLSGLVALAGVVAALSLTLFSSQLKPARSSRLKRAFLGALGFALGLVPLVWRNLTQAGAHLYPLADLRGQGPGWLSSASTILQSDTPELGLPAKLLIAAGTPCVLLYLWRARLRIPDRATAALVAFSAAGGLAVAFAPHGLTSPAVLAATLLTSALGLQFLAGLRPRPLASVRGLPWAWCLAGLVSIPLPVHLIWQNLPLALTPTEHYLAKYHRHYQAKAWASVHLAPSSRIIWTADKEHYYLEQSSASIRESVIVKAALLRATNPNLRAQALCALGFDVLAWEDRAHGPESAGLASWLGLSGTGRLYADENVTFFDLRCASSL